MITIFWRTIKDRWRMLAAVTIIGSLVQFMYTSLFPTYSKSFGQSEELFKQMPEALKKAFNMDQFSFNTLDKFLTIEMYSFFWIILMILFTLSLAGTSFAGDVERETVTLTAGQPVSRSRVFWGRYLAGVKLFSVFNIVVNFIVLPIASAFKLHIDPLHLLTIMVMGELFGLAVFSVATAVSTFLTDKSKVYMIVGGTLLVTYVMNIISGISEKFANIKYASPFYYFNPNTFLVKGQYNTAAVLVFGSVIIIGTVVAWWRWRQRDIL